MWQPASQMETRLKTQVIVLVPFAVGPSALVTTADQLMERHRMDESRSVGGGRFDYLVRPDCCFDDPITEGQLPATARRTLHHQVCAVERLPTDLVPGALVIPDGRWHDLADEGWRMLKEPSKPNDEALARWRARYWKLVAENPYCWVVEFLAHS